MFLLKPLLKPHLNHLFFYKGKDILMNEDLPESINPLEASLNEPKKKKQKKSESELNRVLVMTFFILHIKIF
jgi:hypothetical protein